MILARGRAATVHVLRMQPGEDVRRQLAQWCAEGSVEAAAVTSAVGSLSRACVRYAGQAKGTITEGDLEICALSGTLSRHGMHLHLALATSNGQMIGGHLLEGCIVRTTLELVVQEFAGLRFLRRQDPATGYEELLPEIAAT